MSTAIGPDVISVVVAAARGDEIAFARIVAAHDGDMSRVAYIVSGDLEIAHEAVQSAWSIAWRRLGSLRDADRLRPWLVSIAANEARQLVRRRRRVIEVPIHDLAGSADDVGDENVAGDRLLDLRNALARLTAEDRAIVAMRFALGMTSLEIGREIGLSGPGVRSRLARALTKLRRDLGDA